MSNPLVAIVCGYERGGTTLVSEILRQHPKINSGFEGGLLFSDNPHDFRSLEPYVTSLKISWGVSDEDLKYICDGVDWQDVYKRLLEKSTKVDSEYVFDKTPRYMEFLSDVLARVDVPCIAIVRDPRALFFSWAKRSGISIDDWSRLHLSAAIERYERYGRGLQNALVSNPQGILVVQYEFLCINPVIESEKIMKFIGVDFDPTFVQFASPQKNIHERNVSSKYISEYQHHFDDKVCRKIKSKLKKFEDWFWSDNPSVNQ
jgi:hypothetical protein